MTEKELKKLSRKQLLELLLMQTERADNLEKELSVAYQRLDDKMIEKAEAGSIAEAALKINGVFDACEAAAQQYLENIKRISESNTTIAQEIEDEARARADAIYAETEERCKQREAQAEKKLRIVNERLKQLYRHKKMLDSLFKDVPQKSE